MFVVATAGHVDHGKSTLVRSLTNMDPDRWAEEKRRGVTIDLGFVWTTLPSGADIAFVDVPGHERFVTTMLAGVGPCPTVLLVIAADQGWCQQTGEHVAALDALGVEQGVLAITRSDLGDADLALEEAREYLAGTTLADIPAVAVSSVTGAGLGSLLTALDELGGQLRPTDASATRLWVDRVFTVRGAGTVVTGTLSTGSLAVGDTLALRPGGARMRVRGLESLGQTVTQAAATARVAVNLRGTSTDEIRRGDALVALDRWRDVATVDVRLTRAVPRLVSEVILHVGSAAVPTRIRPFGPDVARLELTRPLPLHIGDRGVLRDPGRRSVVAGVIVLDVDPPALKRRGAAAVRAGVLADLPTTPNVRAELRRRGAVRRRTLIAMGACEPGATRPDDVVEHDDWWIAAATWTRWSTSLVAAAACWEAAHPLAPAMPVAALTRELDLPEATLVGALVAAGDTLVLDADGVHRPEATAALPASARQGLDALLARLDEHPFAAPEAAELQQYQLDEPHLALAVRTGELIRLAPGVYLRPDAPVVAVDQLHALPSPFTLSQARQALHTTRRVGVPLLELLDRLGYTERINTTERRLR